jgi:membrane fusion protein, macrolide-specific efflux system
MQRTNARHPFTRIMTTGALLSVLILGAGCGLLPKEEEEAPPALVAPQKVDKATYTVRRESIEEKVSLRAIYSPAQQADLFYKAPGRLRAVYVQAGDQVTAGQVLAELYADDANYQLAQARIRLEKAKLGLGDAKQKAQFNGSPSLQSDIKRLELDVQSADMEVARYEAQVADARLVAPFAGQMTAVDAKPGDAVQGYTPIMSIADPTALIIEADVSEAELAKLAVGMKARLDFADAPDVTSGVVVELPDPKAKSTSPSQSKRIKVKPEKTSEKAKMSSIGKVHVVLQEKKDVLVLENAAIRRFSGRTYVLTREPRREVDIVTGIEDELKTEIAKGPLKEGDVVVGR